MSREPTQALQAAPSDVAEPCSDGEASAYPSRCRCRICEGPLTVHEEARGGVCAAAHCRRSHLLRETTRRKREEAERLEQLAGAWQQRVAARLGIPAESLTLGVLPSNDDRLSPLSDKRRLALRASLDEALTEVMAEGAGATDMTEEVKDPLGDASAAEQALLRLGCSTCRGQCCSYGKDHAFLDAKTIRRYRAAHPKAQTEAIRAAYLEKLPEQSVRRSCVYHGSRGCTLPRDMRSDICNTFYCQKILEMREKISDASTTHIFAVAAGSTKPRRAAILDPSGVRQRFRWRAPREPGE